MAEKRQFGGLQAPQFGDTIPAGESRDSVACAQCEAMLADALDGTLTAAEQAVFDAHVAACRPCSEMLADARRGAAWLEMLRDPRPEPPPALLERILAQTSGSVMGQVGGLEVAPVPTVAHVAMPAVSGTVLPFRARIAAALRGRSFVSTMLQPRLAMTAAMAFFSIALTLNLTGVRLTDMRPADLRPSSIRRGFYLANARVVQYYEGLRVVYELESRVHDLESDSDAGTGTPGTPAKAAPSQAPAAGPGASPSEERQPSRQQTPGKTPGPGSSRRETLRETGRMVAGSDRATPCCSEMVALEKEALA